MMYKIIDKDRLITEVIKNKKYLVYAFVSTIILFISVILFLLYNYLYNKNIYFINNSNATIICILLIVYTLYNLYNRIKAYSSILIIINNDIDIEEEINVTDTIKVISKIYFNIPELQHHIKGLK